MPGPSCEGPSCERLLVRPGRRPKLNAKHTAVKVEDQHRQIDHPFTTGNRPPKATTDWHPSDESALPGDVTADDESLHLGGALEGDEGFHVAQMAHDVEVERDPVAAQDVACQTAHMAGLDGAEILGQSGHRLAHLALVDHSPEADAVELHRRDLAEHLDEHRLDHLALRDRLAELDPSLCVVEGDVVGRNAMAERRSEEHTSELQSLAYLVCRLLLEKKKKNILSILFYIKKKKKKEKTQ